MEFGRDAARHKVQMIFPQMLDPELIGRSAVERTELRDRTDVCLLRARRQIAHQPIDFSTVEAHLRQGYGLRDD
jgi:hypothetical protein